jgi:hypothetical protein
VCDGGVAGIEPGLFEGGLDAGFDFVGDVAVDLGDAFVQAVAEASGLSDFGDAGGDEPGLWLWRSSWKVKPGRMG